MMEFLLARMNTSKKEHMQEITARMDANLAEMNTKMDANQAARARMEAKLDASHKNMMAMLDVHHERIIAPLGKMEATDFKANPEEIESVMEQQEIPKEEAAVMPVREPRKRRRVRNLSAERRQKMKERTRGKSGPRKKSAAACRKVSRHAKVTWQKRKLVRRIGTQENCGP
jgi:hypothetical protein